ncbi:predicted protein [Naegleria gruberi]|uniref:Predicted protein n=1 Tax=Naegleria gruberi TaxID=5762 RepID=D2VPS0_NAEGR|nr:uncharacterized protein NAEGRDRAFT_70962 [Naegleria gruberi]EFC41254.1 predicted protein [Naegleria gruberi]|eukprot:XP_002673998.1 predicted protein [Naegleria gruberi strain NEG-M]
MYTEQDVERIREVYTSYDYHDLGYIDAKDAKEAFIELGYEISLDEILKLLDALSKAHNAGKDSNDDELSSSRHSDSFNPDKIEFYLFMELLQRYSASKDDEANEEDILDAFIALGGNPNKTGTISINEMRSFCERFDLNFDVPKIAKENGISYEGNKLEYAQFKSLMSIKTQH